MTYTKPEVAVLGEAAGLIQGTRIQGQNELPQNDFKHVVSDCEFDD